MNTFLEILLKRAALGLYDSSLNKSCLRMHGNDVSSSLCGVEMAL